jgi:ketosteroid isomerase-like protein
MRRILVLTVLIPGLSLLASGQTPPKQSKHAAKGEEQLRSLVRMWDEATVRGDAATLDRLLADEFAFVGGPNKAQYLASMRSKPSDLSIESAVSSDLQVQVYGNTAIVTGLDTITGKNKGQPYTNKWLYMDVWIRRDGRWQCVKTYSSLSKR